MLLNGLNSNDYSRLSLDESRDSNFIMIDFIFDENHQRPCQNVYLLKEINKMYFLLRKIIVKWILGFIFSFLFGETC